MHPVDGDPLESGATIGTELRDAIVWVLVGIPVSALSFAVFGATLGAICSNPRGARQEAR